jgi:hypothetical protein
MGAGKSSHLNSYLLKKNKIWHKIFTNIFVFVPSHSWHPNSTVLG